MTQDEIKELAKQAGGTAYVNRHFPGKLAVAFSGQALIDFVALVRERKPLSAQHIYNMMPDRVSAQHDGDLMIFARAIEAAIKEQA